MAKKSQGCWLTRVMKLENLLDLNLGIDHKEGASSNVNLTKIKRKFDRHWLRRINQLKSGKNDPLDHYKLRTYIIFKG